MRDGLYLLLGKATENAKRPNVVCTVDLTLGQNKAGHVDEGADSTGIAGVRAQVCDRGLLLDVS